MQRAISRWALWLTALAVTTAVFRSTRDEVAQPHVAILYLLIVLGGSASGGRALGLVLSALCFGLIDYYFQAPYDTLAVSKGLDWLVLVAFLVTATVATNLLARAQREAAEARRRTDEARALAGLGAEMLRHASPGDAVHAVVALIRRTLGVEWCVVRAWDAEGGLDTSPDSAPADAGVSPFLDDALLTATAASGHALVVRASGTPASLPTASINDGEEAALADASALLLPLHVEQHVVGVLGVADARPLSLDAAARRRLSALAYYAAVALERRRLAADAAHTAALREANRLKDMVLVSVSHDLRTPLTTIKLLAQSAGMEGSTVGTAIEEQADRLERLVTDVLELSRLRAHELPVNAEVNAAEDLTGALVRQVRGILDERRLQVAIDLDAPVLVGRFDFVHALRILTNLVGNALRFTPLGGVVELGVTRDATWLAFTVADRGPGVPASERALIFEPFYRPPDAPPDAGRAGLGLAIARQLADAQGGTLAYAPRDGGGSVFTLRLPAAELGDLDDVAEPRASTDFADS